MPGGIWQERAHGCWTQLQITYAIAASWGLTYPSTLLHEVARFAQSQESREIISMIVVQNPRTVTVRSEHQASALCLNVCSPPQVCQSNCSLPQTIQMSVGRYDLCMFACGAPHLRVSRADTACVDML